MVAYRKISHDELDVILDNHRKWLEGEEGGERADFRFANLDGVSFKGVNLNGADFRYADSQYANFRLANLREADFRFANLDGVSFKGVNLNGADFRYADSQYANFRLANLREADFRYASFRYANLDGTFLNGADFRYADFRFASFRFASFRFADFREADFRGADLQEANFLEANFRDADLREADVGESPIMTLEIARMAICPEEGSFIAFKKARYEDASGGLHSCIVKLEIPADAKRSNATGRKCRASKARVVSVEDIDGNVIDGSCHVFSMHDRSFSYSNGAMVVPTEPFDDDRWRECAPGIHFYITRREAVEH